MRCGSRCVVSHRFTLDEATVTLHLENKNNFNLGLNLLEIEKARRGWERI
jgi:hypothetical protein